MSRSNQRHSESGFSLVQVLIAVGLTSIVSFILAQKVYSLTSIQQRARIESELMDRVEDMRRALIRSDACVMSLNSAGQPLTTTPHFPLNLERIVDENNQILFQRDHEMAGGSLIVSEITAQLSPSTPDWTANSLVVLDMTIKVELKGVSFGVNSMMKRFSLTVETGPLKELVNCNSVDRLERVALEDAICNSFGGKMTPEQTCDLRGSTSLIQAACESVGLSAKGDHCE